jgi:hypothetical protein
VIGGDAVGRPQKALVNEQAALLREIESDLWWYREGRAILEFPRAEEGLPRSDPVGIGGRHRGDGKHAVDATADGGGYSLDR